MSQSPAQPTLFTLDAFPCIAQPTLFTYPEPEPEPSTTPEEES